MAFWIHVLAEDQSEYCGFEEEQILQSVLNLTLISVYYEKGKKNPICNVFAL